jgi:hypothetical protein
MKNIRTVLLALACAFALPAVAQMSMAWIWIDKNGQKVFSDRAPPNDVPENKIIKRPGGVKAPVAVVVPAVTASAPAAAASRPARAASGPRLATSDPALEAKKKAAEQAEKDKALAIAEENKAKRAESCTQAKKNLDLINSGVRLRQTNAKGEPEVMDDAQRAVEAKRVQKIVDTDCKVAQ